MDTHQNCQVCPGIPGASVSPQEQEVANVQIGLRQGLILPNALADATLGEKLHTKKLRLNTNIVEDEQDTSKSPPMQSNEDLPPHRRNIKRGRKGWK